MESLPSPEDFTSFYTRLDNKSTKILKALVLRLNAQKKSLKRTTIAEKITSKIDEHLSEEDLFPLRYFLDVNENITEIFRLEDHYFETKNQHNLPSSQYSYERLVKTLASLDDLEPSYLIECIELTMQCSAATTVDVLNNLIQNHVNAFYNRFLLMETS